MRNHIENRNRNNHYIIFFDNDMNKLNIDEQNSCTGLLTEEECEKH